MNNVVSPMRNVLHLEQDRDRRGPASEREAPSRRGSRLGDLSHLFPGHEQRMAWHMMQVRNHPCPCGSGVRFGDCCLGKHRCKDCGRHFLAPNESGEGRPPDWQVCPHCGSKRTVAMHLREVCG